MTRRIIHSMPSICAVRSINENADTPDTPILTNRLEDYELFARVDRLFWARHENA
jgi:hypothetical protein